ncbi:pre-mRNA-splicing factor prp46, partial [Kickxella alabastrina]
MDNLVDSAVRSTNCLFPGESAGIVALDANADILKGQRTGIATKYRDEYLVSRELPRGVENSGAKLNDINNSSDLSASFGPALTTKLLIASGGTNSSVAGVSANASTDVEDEVQRVLDGLAGKQSKSKAKKVKKPTRELVLAAAEKGASMAASLPPPPGQQIVRKRNYDPIKPEWHAPWKLMRVISGHVGWVRSLAVEPGNKWFASGSVDRTIKIWDLASGTLKLTLTGHISPVRGLAVSPRHPYLFSCGEDKQVKCWDLETNKVVRQYHGHLSGVYALALHPVLDVLITGGRDAVAR